MKRLIVYDLDGTLVDTLADITEAANHMLRQLQKPSVASGIVRGYIGGGVHELVSRCLHTRRPSEIEHGVKIFRTYYAEHVADQSRLYPGAQALLEYFKSRHQAVLTNKPNPYSIHLLATLGVAEYFFAVIGGEAIYPKKPDPAALQALMAQAGTTPGDTLLIGDSPIDIQTGRNAGVFTVVLTHGFSDGASLRAESPGSILKGFNELLGVALRKGW